MKIIQLNIWQGKFEKLLIEFLSAEKPDFICMQEVNDLKGRPGYQFFATLDDIKEGTGLRYAFMSPTYSSRYQERELEYGNAMLSRLPFKSTDTVFTHGKYGRNYDVELDDSDMNNNRNLQVASVEVNGKRLNILNHHGYWIYGTKDGNDKTLRSMEVIADSVRKLERPVILCGDFNLAPKSKSLALINKELSNLSAKNGLKSTVQHRFNVVNEVIDYIFVNDQVKVRSFKMPDELVSDHKALIMEFAL